MEESQEVRSGCRVEWRRDRCGQCLTTAGEEGGMGSYTGEQSQVQEGRWAPMLDWGQCLAPVEGAQTLDSSHRRGSVKVWRDLPEQRGQLCRCSEASHPGPCWGVLTRQGGTVKKRMLRLGRAVMNTDSSELWGEVRP